MDDELDQRLQAVQSAAESAAVEAGDKVDILDIRNEIEAAEERLARLVQEAHDSVSRLAGLIEANGEAIRRVQSSVDEVAGTVEAIQAELPSS